LSVIIVSPRIFRSTYLWLCRTYNTQSSATCIPTVGIRRWS